MEMKTFGDRMAQTFAFLLTVNVTVFSFIYQFLFVIFLVVKFYWSIKFWTCAFGISIAYIAWYLYDRKRPEQGSGFWEPLYNLSIWRHLANYFPMKIIKTADIPADRNYIFAIHPHGPGATSLTITFATNGNNFKENFPGIRSHLTTIPVNFRIPLRRELAMLFRLIPCSPEAIEYVLSRPQKGAMAAIMPGGMPESSRPEFFVSGKYKLFLRRRKGFVRLAIKHGATIVPVFIFGECDIFRRTTYRGRTLFYGQSLLAALLPEEWAEKMPWWLRYGLMPFNVPVNLVVGSPMHLEQNSDPTQEEIDAIHEEYCTRLRALFDEHKVEFGGLTEDAELEIV